MRTFGKKLKPILDRNQFKHLTGENASKTKLSSSVSSSSDSTKEGSDEEFLLKTDNKDDFYHGMDLC